VSYFGEVMSDAPSAYWRLGETSGAIAADWSANGRHGAWSGAPALGATGALDSDADRCALLDGVDDKLTLPALPAIGTTFTLELWFRPQSGGDATQCLIGEAGGGKVLLFKSSSGKLSAFYSAADHLSTTPLAFDTWHHIGVVVAAGAGTFYVDGVADGTFASFPGGFAPDRIGDDNAGNTFKGYLDEVALYAAAALSQMRLSAHYAAAWRGLLGLRQRLRRELRDEDAANYRWTDAELDRHIGRALDDISRAWPDERVTALTTTPGSRDLSIASLDRLQRIEAVEYPAGSWPPEFVQWQTWGSTLTLLVDGAPSSATPVNVYWGRRHEVELRTSTLPQAADETLVLGAGAYALLELAQYAVNRINLSRAAEDEFKRQGEERLARFRDQLRRFGDAGRVRASQLFAPARPAPSQSAVRWEA
jgi:hypothetical protein